MQGHGTRRRWAAACLAGIAGIAGGIGPAPAGAASGTADDEGAAHFEAKIRPVLVEHCYSCHSAEARKSKGGLRLDTRAALLKGGDTGPALVPGKPEESLLIQALRHQDIKMPPKGRLPDAVIADFVKWVATGAPDPRGARPAKADAGPEVADPRTFWAFQPVARPAPPQVRDTAWPSAAVDRFVLARLEAAGLAPVAPAGKRELIRRATFDLIGLPPTPEEVEAFVADDSPDAFARVVDRLLASPHYGERWGRHWLDVARYAEDQAHTFGVKPNTEAWRYRDWVIGAFNADMPYDRFVRLQIAADLIETDEAARLRHLPALGFFGLGAQYYKNSDAAKAAADELDDRVDTLTRGFLGLTVSCARCHDHKYDPIPTQDYYSLAGVFQSCRLATSPLAPQTEVRRYEEGRKRVRDLDGRLKKMVLAEGAPMAEAKAGAVAAHLLSAWRHRAARKTDGKWSVADQAKADGLDPEVLDRWVKWLAGGGQKPKALEPWRKAVTGAAAITDATVAGEADRLQQQARAALSARGTPSAGKDDPALLSALFGEAGLMAPTEAELRAGLSDAKRAAYDALTADLAALRKEHPEKITDRFPVSHVIVEGTPKDLAVFVRGNPAKPGTPAPRRFLRALAGENPPPFRDGSGRRELADAVADRNNPLTARVMANRIWQHHFGRGLVGTPSNFGQLGERPTHPELLDHLAGRLIDSGWSIKTLHREIMLSSVYRLSTAPDRAGLAGDADNRLLWRMNRRRLDVEAWRDAMLAVAGRLDRTLGGPSLDLSSSANRRRTVYARISRHELDGLLRLFDFPDANITADRRTETTVPQQQLFVLNGPFVVEQAKALAARVASEAPDNPARVRRMFALAYGRPADDDEVRLATEFLAAGDPDGGKARLTRWERLAQAVLGANEFLYLD